MISNVAGKPGQERIPRTQFETETPPFGKIVIDPLL